MLVRLLPKCQPNPSFVRCISDSAKATRRFMQTAPLGNTEMSYIPYKFQSQRLQTQNASNQASTTSQAPSGWERHSLGARSFKDVLKKNSQQSTNKSAAQPQQQQQYEEQQIQPPAPAKQQATTSAAPKKARVRRTLKPRKALITLSSNAVEHLKGLLDQPTPQMIRIGVRNRGCSGLTYHLEYIEEPNKFDEIVEQDGVKVVIDSKALFSIVGSEMDWLDDKISSRFIFKNPNSKGTCGCGESFMV